MKIIIPGKSHEELERMIKKTKVFKCPICYCVFEADEGEYYVKQIDYNHDSYFCKCPNCGNDARRNI